MCQLTQLASLGGEAVPSMGQQPPQLDWIGLDWIGLVGIGKDGIGVDCEKC